MNGLLVRSEVGERRRGACGNQEQESPATGHVLTGYKARRLEVVGPETYPNALQHFGAENRRVYLLRRLPTLLATTCPPRRPLESPQKAPAARLAQSLLRMQPKAALPAEAGHRASKKLLRAPGLALSTTTRRSPKYRRCVCSASALEFTLSSTTHRGPSALFAEAFNSSISRLASDAESS